MQLTYGQSIRHAIYDAMNASSNIVLMGEDIRYNLYGYTEGLYNTFGPNRVIDTPLSEAAFVGCAAGSAMCGLRVIVDLTVANFLYVAMDQVVNMISKTRYMYDGQFKLPVTIICSTMNNASNGAQHSDRPHSIFMSLPGLKVVAPTSPQDVYSMLRVAFEDSNPTLCFTDRSLFYEKSEVDFSYENSFYKCKILQHGTNITLISIAGAINESLKAVAELEEMGISVELIDVRSLSPLDTDSIYKSVCKTGKAVIVDTANRVCSAASEISSRIAEEIFEYLNAPIGIVSYDQVPVPFACNLEQVIMPNTPKIVSKVLAAVNYSQK